MLYENVFCEKGNYLSKIRFFYLLNVPNFHMSIIRFIFETENMLYASDCIAQIQSIRYYYSKSMKDFTFDNWLTFPFHANRRFRIFRMNHAFITSSRNTCSLSTTRYSQHYYLSTTGLFDNWTDWFDFQMENLSSGNSQSYFLNIYFLASVKKIR